MPIALRGFGAASTGTGNRGPSASSGLTVGDVEFTLLGARTSNGSFALSTDWAWAPGFPVTHSGGGKNRVWLAWRRHAAGLANNSWTYTAGSDGSGNETTLAFRFAFSGVPLDATLTFDGAEHTGAVTTIFYPDGPDVAAGELLLGLVHMAAAWTAGTGLGALTNSDLAGFAKISEARSTTGLDASLAASYVIPGAAGNPGDVAYHPTSGAAAATNLGIWFRIALAAVISDFSLDPADAADIGGSAATLSNGNLTATKSAAEQWRIVRSKSTAYRNSGRLVFEAKINGGSANTQAMVGLAPASLATVVNYLGTAGSTGWNAATGHVWSDGPTMGQTAAWRLDVNPVMLAVDFKRKRWWGKRAGGQWCDNDALHDPSRGLGGWRFDTLAASLAPAVAVYDFEFADSVTLNYGETAFHNTAPPGFQPWATGTLAPVLAPTFGHML